jgi:hypothetical protein
LTGRPDPWILSLVWPPTELFLLSMLQLLLLSQKGSPFYWQEWASAVILRHDMSGRQVLNWLPGLNVC